MKRMIWTARLLLLALALVGASCETELLRHQLDVCEAQLADEESSQAEPDLFFDEDVIELLVSWCKAQLDACREGVP